jgi:hypothetical protein
MVPTRSTTSNRLWPGSPSHSAAHWSSEVAIGSKQRLPQNCTDRALGTKQRRCRDSGKIFSKAENQARGRRCFPVRVDEPALAEIAEVLLPGLEALERADGEPDEGLAALGGDPQVDRMAPRRRRVVLERTWRRRTTSRACSRRGRAASRPQTGSRAWNIWLTVDFESAAACSPRASAGATSTSCTEGSRSLDRSTVTGPAVVLTRSERGGRP